MADWTRSGATLDIFRAIMVTDDLLSEASVGTFRPFFCAGTRERSFFFSFASGQSFRMFVKTSNLRNAALNYLSLYRLYKPGHVND